jgi:hypothetical protein
MWAVWLGWLLLYCGVVFALSVWFASVTTLSIWWHALFMLPIAILLYILFSKPLLYVTDDIRLITDRSPAQVHAEFQGVDNPLAIWAYAQAGEENVDIHENGATYKPTTRFGGRTVPIRYETEQQPNGDLIVRSWKNGTESTISTVSIESADNTGSLVTVRGGYSNRISLQTLLMLVVRGKYLVAVFEASGYDLIEDKTHIGLR